MTATRVTIPSWLTKYEEEFLTLEELGTLEGITREGARQRLIALGIVPRSTKETHELRRLSAISAKSGLIREHFLRNRDLEQTAMLVALPVDWVKSALEETVPDYEVLTRAPRSTAKNYSSSILLDCLREAAAAQVGTLTASGYTKFVRAHPTLSSGQPRPGQQAVTLRFGSWLAALKEAKLPANPHSGPSKEYTEEDAVSAVVECWRQLGHPPTVKAYDAWQRGESSRPGEATVRKLTGKWNSLIVRAWQLVHGLTLDQDDSEVSVPEGLLASDGASKAEPALVPYRAADEGADVSLRGGFATNTYNALERAVRSHATIQNAVASAGEAAGLRQWSPSLSAPAFDILLTSTNGRGFLVEVKSATQENLELQLRIALGQVLSYVYRLRPTAFEIFPAIAIEIQPDDSWAGLLAELGVHLIVFESIPDDVARMIAHARPAS